MARTGRRGVAWAVAAASALALSGCTGGDDVVSPPVSEVATTPPATTDASAAPTASHTPFVDDWIDGLGSVTLDPAATPADVTTGLEAPWSVVRLDGGAVLVSERDSGRVLEVLADGSTREVLTIPGVAHGGEGGLLGLAATSAATSRETPGGGEAWLFAMFTADDGNRIVRVDLTVAAPGSVAAGNLTVLLSGIPKASNHNGGRLAIGPDGLLYATAGDAAQPDLAQDPQSLAGKILRLGLDGTIPADNPFGNPVYSMGHRNPQGLAWDRDGRLWASEFGQNTWDELNRIEPGVNYGWPIVEGVGTDPAYRNPVLQWSTSEASPSGLTRIGDTLFLASLRGERVWRIDIGGGEAIAEPLLVGEHGRIRDVLPGPDQTLWIVTNNTDGRGSPSAGDDRILQVPVVPR